MLSDDELDRELTTLTMRATDARPVRASTDALVGALESAETRRALARELGTRRRGRRWRIGVGIVVAVIVVGAPATAVGVSLWTAHTNTFGGTGSEIADQSEWLGLDASDAPQAVLDAYPADLPLPRGATRDDVIVPVAALLSKMGVVPAGESGHVAIQETAVQFIYENAGRCLWYREWLDADAQKDEARLNAATAGIQDAVTWPATVTSDGGGVVDALQKEADAAASGDRVRMVLYYGRGCDYFYGSVIR